MALIEPVRRAESTKPGGACQQMVFCVDEKGRSVTWAFARGLSSIRLLLGVDRLDPTTEVGRANERHRRVALSALTSTLARVISIATAFISVPLTVGYLGPERYGMWMVLSSITAMIAFADFGIGNGVLGLIARAHGAEDIRRMRQIISTAYLTLGTLATALIAAFAVAYPWIAWSAFFNVTSTTAVRESGPAIAAFAAMFALAIPVTIVQRVQMGLQQGFASNLWQCAASVLALCAVLVAIYFEAELMWLVLGFAGVPVIIGMANTVVFFARQRRDLMPKLAFFNRGALDAILKQGFWFFLLQLSVAVAFASNSLVIAQILGASAAAPYGVVERMFSVITIILGLGLAPLWPAYGEAVSRGDHAWVRRTFHLSLTATLAVAGVVSLGLLAFGPMLLRLWVGTTVTAPYDLLIAFAVWKMLESTGIAIATFLNGVNELRIQVVTGLVAAAASIALKIWLVHALGIAGAVWGMAIAYAAIGLPVTFIAARRALPHGSVGIQPT